jgi:hypothetical protein
MRLTAICTVFGSLAATIAYAVPASALDLAGLSNRNEIVLFSDMGPGKARALAITGVTGKIIGIDVRPADGLLYALGTDSTLYTINTQTGAATQKAKLSVPIDSVDHIIVDFNPQADRMRIVGSTGQSLRVNVDTGQTIVDGKLAYRAGDRNAGKAFGIYAGAYINSFKGATQTQLFEIDSKNGTYVVQDPPNDGVLRTVGMTGLPANTIVEGMDIYTDAKDNYIGFAVAGAALHSLDVGTGKLRKIGAIGNGKTAIIDIAVLTPRM